MRVCFTARLRATVLCGLLLLASLPVFAFDEDHHEVINGAMLHFRVRGADKTHPYLVILHGGPGFSSHMFYAWGPSLEKTLNVVYLDQRGSGESARLTVANVMAPAPAEIKGYTVANLLGDIEGVRQFLKVDKWYVLGHSWGGMLGLEYVTAHPDHVRGYIHMDGLVSVPQMQNSVLDNAAKKFAAATPRDDVDLVQVTQLRALPPDNPIRLFGALGLAMGPAGLYFAGNQAAGFSASYAQIGAAIKPYHLSPTALLPASEPAAALIVSDHFLTRDDTSLLAKVTVPTLILNGKQDGVIPPSTAEAAHAAIKGSQLVELDHCGHFPFFEQPEKTTAAVLAFVESRRTGTKPASNTAAVVGSFSDIHLPQRLGPKGMQGEAIIARWEVDEQGQVSHITLDPPSGNPDVDRAIIKAIYRFRFRPAVRNGLAVPAHLKHTFLLSP